MDWHFWALLMILMLTYQNYRHSKVESEKQTELLKDLLILQISTSKREHEEPPLPQLKGLKHNTIDKKYL